MHSGRDGARLARPTRTLTLKPKPKPRPTPHQGSRGTELDKDFEKLEAEPNAVYGYALLTDEKHKETVLTIRPWLQHYLQQHPEPDAPAIDE